MITTLITLLAALSAPIAGGNPKDDAENLSAHQILAKFKSDAPSWEVRVRSLVRLAQIGEAAVPALIDALENSSPMQREFAAQSLSMITSSSARTALMRVRQDKQLSVRHYARRALRNLRQPETPSLQLVLAGYDLRRINSARVGQTAPDFKLTSARGRAIQLSQFRGEKTVVLEFNGAYD